MKNLTVMLIFLVVISLKNNSAHGQTPNWLWAKRAGAELVDSGEGVAIDRSGNIVVTGFFQGTADFGDTMLTSVNQSEDIFVAKCDGDGNVMWVVQAGGDFFGELGEGIATDSFGNAIVTGSFGSTANFGDTAITSVGGNDIFLAKYDPDGQLLWVAQAGGPNYEVGQSIAIHNSNDIFVTGAFEDMVTFGDTTLISEGGYDMYEAKYSGSGQLLWIRQIGGPSFQWGRSIATDNTGNSFVVGTFSGQTSVGDTTLNGSFHSFVAKYDNNGNFLWVRQISGSQMNSGGSVSLDEYNNIYCAGFFSDSVNFGDTTLVAVSIQTDIFLAKYNEEGVFEWARRIGGIDVDEVRGIAVNGTGYIYLTGFFSDNLRSGGKKLISTDDAKIIVVKYDSDGNFLWAQQGGGMGNGIAVGDSGYSIVTGEFSGTATFGNIMLTSVGGGRDIFVARIEEMSTGIQQPFPVPLSIRLYHNHPNPFNPTTTIRYDIPNSYQVILKIYNILGQEVRTLVNEKQNTGEKAVVWDGRDSFGKDVSSGIYIYQIQAGDHVQSQKMVLLR